MEPEFAHELWTSIGELNWSAESDWQAVVKVPITPQQFLQLESRLQPHDGLHAHLGAAAAILWIAADSTARLDVLRDELSSMGLAGLVVRGSSENIWLGRREESEMARAARQNPQCTQVLTAPAISGPSTPCCWGLMLCCMI